MKISFFAFAVILISICCMMIGVNAIEVNATNNEKEKTRDIYHMCGNALEWSIETSLVYPYRTLKITGYGPMWNFSSKLTVPWRDETFYRVEFDDAVTSVGSNAFFDRTVLNSVRLPRSLERIEAHAFHNCIRLLEVVIQSAATYIGDYAFCECNLLSLIGIPTRIVKIGHYAFYRCLALPSIAIPSTTTSIGDYAFFNCSGMMSVTIPNTLQSIGENAFSGCSGLTNFTIPRNVKSISRGAFFGCLRLAKVVIPNSVKIIGDRAFALCAALVTVALPASVEMIGDRAFYGCSSLKTLDIAGKLESIGESAFYGCRSLTSLIVSNTVRSIGSNAFSGCSSLMNMIIPESVQSLGESVFYGCSNLTSVFIYGAVRAIGKNMFNGCSKLKKLSLPDSIESFGAGAFSGCNLETLFYAGNAVFSQVTGFDTCEALSTLCVSPDYYLPTFLGCQVTNNNSVCQEYQRYFDHCFAAKVIDAITEYIYERIERWNASQWQARTNPCVTFICDEETGSYSWGECNTSGLTMLCVSDRQCIKKEEMKRQVYVEIELEPDVHVSDINSTEIYDDLNVMCDIPEEGNLTVTWANNDDGLVLSIVLYIDDEDSAQDIAVAVRNIEKGDECQHGALCRVKNVRVLGVSQELSGCESLHKAVTKMFMMLMLLLIATTMGL